MRVDPSSERCEAWDMFSETAKPIMRSAAWRISLWATLAFACGTMGVFVFLHQFVAGDIQRRTDAWLTGEVGVLGDVAQRTPKDRLYGRVVREVAELASREVPQKAGGASAGLNDLRVLSPNGQRRFPGFVGGKRGRQKRISTPFETAASCPMLPQIYACVVSIRPFAWSAFA